MTWSIESLVYLTYDVINLNIPSLFSELLDIKMC